MLPSPSSGTKLSEERKKTKQTSTTAIPSEARVKLCFSGELWVTLLNRQTPNLQKDIWFDRMLLDRSDAELLQGGRSASEWAEKCRTNVHLPLEDVSIHGETSLNSPGRDFWWVQAAFSSTWPPRFCETGRPTREAEENWFIGKNKMHITFPAKLCILWLHGAACDCIRMNKATR